MRASQLSTILVCSGAIALVALVWANRSAGKESAMPIETKEGNVYARVIGPGGSLTDSVVTPKFVIPDAE
jgi:hypothetical protein